jgi:DNA-binding NarL/FixJ family response regulator
MRRILIADRDESLQHAFATVLSRERYEIIYASNGKEVEKIAEKMNPDIYIINVNLPKINGIELYKKLQKERYLDDATFFFLKDENDTSQLLGYQAAGVIEKPINFFRVYETITKEDDIIELTDLVEEEEQHAETPFRKAVYASKRETAQPVTESREQAVPEPPTEKAAGLRAELGDRLRDAMGSMIGEPVEEAPPLTDLEGQFREAIGQVLDDGSKQLAAKLAPLVAVYVEDYVRRVLLEVAEKVIREEIDKLLKESGT